MALAQAKYGLWRHCEERSNFLQGDAKMQKIAALPLAMTRFCAHWSLSKCHSSLRKIQVLDFSFLSH
jgi:hypothetical protein